MTQVRRAVVACRYGGITRCNASSAMVLKVVDVSRLVVLLVIRELLVSRMSEGRSWWKAFIVVELKERKLDDAGVPNARELFEVLHLGC